MINLPFDKRCAPGVEYSEGSCYSIESLIKIAHAYNQWIMNENIQEKPIRIINNKQRLLNEISEKISNCSTQRCWLTQPFTSLLNDKNIIKYTFRPDGPQGKFTWLSTTNINDIMEQYEAKLPEFTFLGAVPIDFYSLPMLHIPKSYQDFDKLYKEQSKSKIGIVFNLDEHWQSGSHWTALYTDLNNKQVYYFDSVSTKPNKRIREFMLHIIKYIIHTHHCQLQDIDIKYNPLQHQFKNSECGVYSCNFLIRLLNNETYHNIILNQLSDDNVNKCRSIYFNNINII